MLKKGLLQRRRTKEDARAYAVKLTDEGWRVLKSAEPMAKRVDDRILSALPNAQRERFIERSQHDRGCAEPARGDCPSQEEIGLVGAEHDPRMSTRPAAFELSLPLSPSYRNTATRSALAQGDHDRPGCGTSCAVPHNPYNLVAVSCRMARRSACEQRDRQAFTTSIRSA